MCRLLGMYGRVAEWRDIAAAFSRQAETGRVPPTAGTAPGHKDGWGMTISNCRQTAMVPLVRQLGSAMGSQAYREALSSLPAQPAIFLCHLRKASDMIPITLSNTHPFFQNAWAFIHNGTLYDAQSLSRNSNLAYTSDDSDSEHLFHYLLTKIAERPRNTEIAGSIAAAVAALDIDYTALNFLLSNGRQLYVVRHFRKHAEYYSLYHCQLPDGVIICSEPIDLKGYSQVHWQLLDNHCLLKISGNPVRIAETAI